MSDNLKMFGRYAIATGVSYAAGKGWITPGQAAPVTQLVLEMAALLASFGPAIYAARNVSNKPKVSQ